MILHVFTFWFLRNKNVCWNFTDVEWVSVKYRSLSALLMGLDGTAGTWILVGFAYGVKEWRMLILAATSPLILAVVAWWYLTFAFHIFYEMRAEPKLGHWDRNWPHTCVLCQVASRVSEVAPGQGEDGWSSSVHCEMCKDKQQRKGMERIGRNGRNEKLHTGGAFKQCLLLLLFFRILCMSSITISSNSISPKTNDQLDHLVSF